jgi:hypothetical protein
METMFYNIKKKKIKHSLSYILWIDPRDKDYYVIEMKSLKLD